MSISGNEVWEGRAIRDDHEEMYHTIGGVGEGAVRGAAAEEDNSAKALHELCDER